jgi:hypothetical protein
MCPTSAAAIRVHWAARRPLAQRRAQWPGLGEVTPTASAFWTALSTRCEAAKAHPWDATPSPHGSVQLLSLALAINLPRVGSDALLARVSGHRRS